MTRDRDDERELRAWLAGPTDQLPDVYLDAALNEISTTHQRRRLWLAWRLSEMNHTSRYVLVGAVVIIAIAVGALALRPGDGFGSGSTPTPIPSATAAATPTPQPTPSETQIAAANFVVPFTITVPSAWSSGFGDAHRVGTYAGSSETGFWGVNVYAGVRLYSDPCHPSAGFTTSGEFTTPADLLASLATLPGLTVSSPAAYNSPGHSGLMVSFQYTGDAVGCELPNAGVQVFATNLVDHDAGINAGYQQRWFVSEDKGKLIVIEAWAGSVPLADKMSVLQPIVDSITFH